MRKTDFTLPPLDDLFTTQEMRDDAKLERVQNIPLSYSLFFNFNFAVFFFVFGNTLFQILLNFLVC